jgi:hypothetical protein
MSATGPATGIPGPGRFSVFGDIFALQHNLLMEDNPQAIFCKTIYYIKLI